MKIVGFSAQADLVGRRARVTWTFVLEALETLADIPPVAVWRKTDDFAFSQPPGAGDGAGLVYNSALFPPAPAPGVYVSDLPGWQVSDNGRQKIYDAISVATDVGDGQKMEILRRTQATIYDAPGAPVARRVELIELGGAPGALKPGVAYYYQLFSPSLPPGADMTPYGAETLVGDSFALNRWLYDQLPAIYRRNDTKPGPGVAGAEYVPEAVQRGGQLRRFVDLFGIAMDALRSSADGLNILKDIDAAPASLLAHLANAIGWDLEVDIPTAQLRNEIKSATRYYNTVGTNPGLRSLVGRYTGWYAQVAEFYQNIARANRASMNNLFSFVERGGAFVAAADASPILGFADGQSANGSGANPAALVSAAGPFALSHGMGLDVRLGGGAPLRVVFGAADFADISQATAAELAAAIVAVAPEIDASASGAALRLATRDVGANAQIAIAYAAFSLFAFEGAPGGRPAATSDAAGVARVFYEKWRIAAAAAADGDLTDAIVRELRYKTFVNGAWRDALTAVADATTAQADPAPAILPDGRVWLGWIDNPGTAQARLRVALGAERPSRPASLLGAHSEPFTLVAGGKLTLTGSFAGADTFVVKAADYANPAAATALELANAMNAQFTRAKASRAANGALRLDTVATGPAAAFAVDLRHSTAAFALGFAQPGSAQASGGFDETIDWSPAATNLWPGLPLGRWAELATEPSGAPEGGARLAFSGFVAGLWRVFAMNWDERALVATGAGLSVNKGGAWTTIGAAAGLPSADVRGAAIDDAGQVWIATGAGAALLAAGGAITLVNQAAGLPSNDIRALAIGTDGAVWFATAAGVGQRRPDGTVAAFGLADGLPSLDVRDVATTLSGDVYFATAAGLALRTRAGVVSAVALPASLPSSVIVALAPGPEGALLIGGLGFTALLTRAGVASRLEATGSPAADIRAVAFDAFGVPIVASARGVALLSPDLSTVTNLFDTGVGLSSIDLRSVTPGPDGLLWVSSPAGLDLLDPVAGAATHVAAGPASNDVRRIAGWRSAPFELSSGLDANREPSLARDGQERLWAIWSQRQPGEDCWTLSARLFAATGWGPVFPVTQAPAGGRAADRAPAATAAGPAAMQVFFSSDRGGGARLYQANVPAGGGGAAPIPATALGPGSAQTWALAATIGGKTWLIARADENVALAQCAPPPPPPAPSYRAADAVALRRAAGALTPRLDDLARIARARGFGDLMSYTPQKPLGPLEPPLQDDDLYTPATVGLYVSNPVANQPITSEEAGRLRDLLTRFLPINRRAIVIIIPTVDAESVYADGAEIGESWSDVYPFADTLTGLSDSTAAALPQWSVLHANIASDVSANPADLTTLRRRSFYPPPQ